MWDEEDVFARAAGACGSEEVEAVGEWAEPDHFPPMRSRFPPR